MTFLVSRRRPRNRLEIGPDPLERRLGRDVASSDELTLKMAVPQTRTEQLKRQRVP